MAVAARDRRNSSKYRTKSASGTASATQLQTMASMNWPQLKIPAIARTSRKIIAQAKLRVIHCRCSCTLPFRMNAIAISVQNIQIAAWNTAAIVKERVAPALAP